MIDWPLLRSVSRSFFLTIRLLPRAVREPIALGYLLARASDSIADTSDAEIERRVEALQQLRHGDTPPHALEALIARQDNPDEAALLRALPHLLDQLDASPAKERLEWVWGHILRGQIFDLVRFAESPEPLGAGELDEYTFLVAGCVGEFWTRLCAESLEDFSRCPVEELVPLGVAYGKGLQLVNILRDRQADAGIGRIYVEDRDFDAVKSRAREGLECGLRWISAVNHGRVRFACVPPARIGLETLERIAVDSGRVKISRDAVRRVLAGAIPALWTRGR